MEGAGRHRHSTHILLHVTAIKNIFFIVMLKNFTDFTSFSCQIMLEDKIPFPKKIVAEGSYQIRCSHIYVTVLDRICYVIQQEQ